MQTFVHTGLLYFVTSEIVYFDSFGAEHVPEEIKKNDNIIPSYFKDEWN